MPVCIYHQHHDRPYFLVTAKQAAVHSLETAAECSTGWKSTLTSRYPPCAHCCAQGEALKGDHFAMRSLLSPQEQEMLNELLLSVLGKVKTCKRDLKLVSTPRYPQFNCPWGGFMPLLRRGRQALITRSATANEAWAEAEQPPSPAVKHTVLSKTSPSHRAITQHQEGRGFTALKVFTSLGALLGAHGGTRAVSTCEQPLLFRAGESLCPEYCPIYLRFLAKLKLK